MDLNYQRETISDIIEYDFHKENILNQLNNPRLGIKQNFYNAFNDTIKEFTEDNSDELSEEDLNEIEELKQSYFEIIKDNLEEVFNINFDISDENSKDIIISFYKLFYNRRSIVINSVIKYILKEKHEIIKELELDPNADDVTTQSYKKVFKRNDAIILANVSKVITHVIDNYFTDLKDLLKKSNKYESKKYLEKCIAYLDYIDDDSMILDFLYDEVMNDDILSETITEVSYQLANTLKRKNQN